MKMGGKGSRMITPETERKWRGGGGREEKGVSSLAAAAGSYCSVCFSFHFFSFSFLFSLCDNFF